MEFKYQKPWKLYVLTHSSPNERNLYDFIGHLNDEALYDCVEDILTMQISHLSEMFNKSNDRFAKVEEQFFDALMEAPLSLIQNKLSEAFDQLFIKALDGGYDLPQKIRILKRIKAITAKNKAGLSSRVILLVTEFREDIDESMRIELLMLLSKLEDHGDYSFWDTMRKTIPDRPYIGAAVIEAFKKKYPWEALEVLHDYSGDALKDYEPAPEHIIYFDTAIETALYNCLKEPSQEVITQFWEIKDKIGAPWFAQLVDDILGRPPFLSIKKKMDNEIPLLPLVIYNKVINDNFQISDKLANRLRAQVAALHELLSIIITNHFLEDRNIEILKRFHPILSKWEEITHDYVHYTHHVTLSGDYNILQDDNDISGATLLKSREKVVENSKGQYSLVDMGIFIEDAKKHLNKEDTKN